MPKAEVTANGAIHSACSVTEASTSRGHHESPVPGMSTRLFEPRDPPVSPLQEPHELPESGGLIDLFIGPFIYHD